MFNIRNIYTIFTVSILVLVIHSCGSRKNTPTNCVVSFIIAAEEHDMTKAWDVLTPEAQSYYNDLGEKNRKSGKGILEHDISEIKTFRRIRTDYKLEVDSLNASMIRVKTYGGLFFEVQTTGIDGDYKLKDGNAVKILIKGIAAEIVKKEYY